MPPTGSKAAPDSGSQPPSKKRKMDVAEPKYYAVRAGFKPGVYSTWAICQQQISGFKGAQFKSFSSYEDAAAYAAGRDPPSAANDKPTRYYGVAVGRKPGVYTDWSEAQKAIIGSKGPKYRKFDTRADAEAFVRTYATISGPEEEPPAKKAKKEPGRAPSRSNVLVVYTDGSSLGNGKYGARAGVGVYFGEGDARNISERLQGEPQTNQRAELTAILRALESVDDTQDVEIRTDSKYSIQCVTEWYASWERNGWKTRDGPVKNQDLVQAIREKLKQREGKGGQTQFIWVKGHASDKGNIAADHLAIQGASK